MRRWNVVIVTVMLELLAIGMWLTPTIAQELPLPRVQSQPAVQELPLPRVQSQPAVQELPLPRLVPIDERAHSPEEFQRILTKLRNEREALDAEWQSMMRRLNTPPAQKEPDYDRLEKQIRDWIAREKDRRVKATPAPPQPKPYTPEKPAVPVVVIDEKKKAEVPAPPAPSATAVKDDTSAPVDLLHLAQTLFRVERYEEALEVFRKIDLKGKRPEERVPIVYMTAKCLFYVGRTDDAITLLRTAANATSDERIAGYAQWQIEVLRWYRDTDARLQDVRQRRMATEKR
jgi:tetratricopeptide (TPR) repeat protein